VELSGLPTFDRDRAFRGYRGFGVCRDVAALNTAAARRASGGRADVPSEIAPPEEPKPLLTLVPPAQNVVPFRAAAPVAGEKRRVLAPVESTNSREIAKVLGAPPEEAAPASEAEQKPDALAEEPRAPAALPPLETAPAPDLRERLERAEQALHTSEAETRKL